MLVPVIPTEKLMGVYFDSMNAGYLSDKRPSIISAQNFTRGFTYKSPCMRFVVDDRWHFNAGRHTVGETLIYYDGMPVWGMQYRDWYDPRAIPVLKMALAQTCHANREFLGGRGPIRFEHGMVHYTNTVHPGSTFDEFSGIEGIINVNSATELGVGRYMGGRLT